MASITLYHDLSSTFSYPALEILRTHPVFSSTPLHIVPIFLGAVFQLTGNKAPPLIPAKGAYLVRDFRRKCAKFSVPLRREFPKKFPFNSVYAQRTAVAVGIVCGEEQMLKVVQEMGRAFWGRGDLTPEDKKQLGEIVKSVVGEEKATKAMGMVDSDEVKAKLKENTEKAVKAGAFGAPWMVVKKTDGKEVVAWGVDGLELVAEALGSEWPPRKEVKAVL